MKTEITWKPTGSEKIKMALDQRKEYKKYFGLWVALDDKDRVISMGKDRNKVFSEAENFSFWSKEWGLKLYKIHDTAERQLVKSLLDDVF